MPAPDSDNAPTALAGNTSRAKPEVMSPACSRACPGLQVDIFDANKCRAFLPISLIRVDLSKHNFSTCSGKNTRTKCQLCTCINQRKAAATTAQPGGGKPLRCREMGAAAAAVTLLLSCRSQHVPGDSTGNTGKDSQGTMPLSKVSWNLKDAKEGRKTSRATGAICGLIEGCLWGH